MTITVAILRAKVVRRKSWGDSLTRVEVENSHSSESAWFYAGSGDIIGRPWMPTSADLFATDWVVAH